MCQIQDGRSCDMLCTTCTQTLTSGGNRTNPIP
jgi:hypothetical protein